MIDHAKCRLCGGSRAGPVFESLHSWSSRAGARANWCRIMCDCGAASIWSHTPEAAWAAWDFLMRPAVPDPLRELVRAVRRLKLACGYVGSMGKRSRLVARSECIHALEALPPDVLAACLKEADDD